MTANEIELIDLIRNNDNPDKALSTAVDIILLYLVQHESSEGRASVGHQELA